MKNENNEELTVDENKNDETPVKETKPEESAKPDFVVKKELGDVSDIIEDSLGDLESVEELSKHSDVSNAGESETPQTITEVDKSGKVFDSSIHASKEGKPILTPTGRFKKLTGVKGAPSNSDSKTIASHLESQAKMIKATGETLAGLYFIAGGTVIGSDFDPETPNEKEQISALFANYLQSKEMKDLPAGWALMIGLGVHAIGKARKPKAQTRISYIAKKIKGFFVKSAEKTKKKNEAETEKEG